jgi:hypothetical protein
VHFI